MMSDEQAKEIFGQVRKSKEADGEGIEGWKVTEHEDWLDVRKEVKAEELASDVEEPQRVDGGRPEDREKIIESFRATHSGVEVDLSDPIMARSVLHDLRLLLTPSRSNYLRLLTSISPSLTQATTAVDVIGRLLALLTER